MKVNRLKLSNFRNYEKIDMFFERGIHNLIGDNAQGKTNLLEAIFLAVLGKSFRAGNDDEMIRWDCASANVEIFYSNYISEHLLQLTMKRDGLRTNILDGNSKRKSEVVGSLNAVLFCTEDLWLIKGSPAIRRKFLDFTLSQIINKYYQYLLQYNRVILQRNHLLKKINYEKQKESLLDAWDDQLSELASQLFYNRIDLINQINIIANNKYKVLSNDGKNFSAAYLIYGVQDNFKINESNYRDWYQKKLRSLRIKDIIRGSTEIGPHKDDIGFFIDNYDAKYYSSQGQQRTAILSLKLAEIEIINNKIGEYPILLLDDVMSELDIHRRKKLIEEVNGKIQTFITGTDKIVWPDKLYYEDYSVVDGSIIKF